MQNLEILNFVLYFAHTIVLAVELWQHYFK